MMPSFVKMYNKISDSENLSMNVHERQHGRLNHDQCIEANIEWFYCIKVVGEARVRRVPVGPDGPRGLKIWGGSSSESCMRCARAFGFLKTLVIFFPRQAQTAL